MIPVQTQTVGPNVHVEIITRSIKDVNMYSHTDKIVDRMNLELKSIDSIRMNYSDITHITS